MKPLVALYKAYRGGEWFGASLESIVGVCSGVVVVLSDRPWRGSPTLADGTFLPENCSEPLAKFKSKHPKFPVIIIRPSDGGNTTGQYRAGMVAISASFGNHCAVLLIDTDEVWDQSDLITLRKSITDDTKSLCFRSKIWTYLRSPLWRVDPQESGRVVVALANPHLPTGKSRLANVYALFAIDKIVDVDCAYHHFGYVRLDPNEITAKLDNCTTQDLVPIRDQWKKNVWDHLPEGTNLHPQVRFEHCWGRVIEVPPSALPEIVTNTDAFWAGLAWHTDSACNVLLTPDQVWRHKVKTLPPEECPPTTVKPAMNVALSRLAETLGHRLTPGSLDFLIPRLRMSFNETMQLALLASIIPAGGRILEIGSGHGGSIATMMLGCPANTLLLTGIDPYLPYNEENVVIDHNVQEGSADRFNETVILLQTLIGPLNVELIRKSSTDAVKDFSADSLDLVLVDGNHSYASCLEDLILWWPKVKSGGILLVHDYASRFPGVIRAIQEFESEKAIIFSLPLRSTLAWTKKV